MTGNEMCVGEHACRHFQQELYAYPWTTNIICTQPSHMATRELYVKGDSHIAPVEKSGSLSHNISLV